MEKIQILLATYNGERFLSAQLDSIFAQQDVEISVLARDDGSTDTTVEILRSYAASYPGRVRLLSCESRLGPMGSFAELMRASDANYVACADQDDVWLPEKLSLLLRRLKATEAEAGASLPVLVHCDLQVVDRDLRKLSSSFWRHSGINPQRNSLRDLLFRNTVTGCATLFNRALIECALPVPAEAVMHDHWMALCAAGCGRIGVEPQALVLYRQHGGNSIGAKLSYREKLCVNVRNVLQRGLPPNDWPQILRQPRAFWQLHRDQLAPTDRVALAALLETPGKGGALRRWLLMRHLLGPGSLLRKLFFWMLG